MQISRWKLWRDLHRKLWQKNYLVKETDGKDNIILKPHTRGKIVDYNNNFQMFYH